MILNKLRSKKKHMKKTAQSWLYKGVRWSLALTFIYAGMSKLPDTGAFAEVIDAYGLVPESMVSVTAVVIPIIELLAGMGLMVDMRGSLAVITGMLTVFIGVLGYALYLGFDIDCGCFSPDDPEAAAFHGLKAAILKDLVMLGGVAYCYVWRVISSYSPFRFKP
jgi:uncharacterized membrane protein YphA (DoxX/SURF4 family)